ncbi:MAG: DUF5618 family protein [Nitrospinae bacterium]|nr:DUF5618 family protein [Nitrospinota bacterium]
MQKREAIRYFENAKEILSRSPIEDNAYADVKYVQEACGTTYLAVLKAIDEYLLNKGLTKKELPKSVDGYKEMIRKHIAIHNGKLLREFEILYEELHIAGYYRGNLRHTKVVKEAFKSAKEFIDKIK